MTPIEIFIVLFLFTTFAAACAPRFKLPVEVFLLLASLAISLLPGLPLVTLSPEIAFTLFLPPILFSAAYFTSWNDFKNSLRPILLMAIGLVLFSTVGVAMLIKWLIPQMSWPVSFLLGAIVSPPDAAATTTLVKKLGMPRRIVTLLEGESLINDATAIIAFRFALTAVVTGSFSLEEASLAFLWMGLGGVILGLCLNFIVEKIYVNFKDSKTKNMFTLAIPYASYFIAEHLGVSGVITTVATGLFFARKLPELSDAETRHKGEAIWEFLIFVINGLVFTLMGLQLQSIIKALEEFSTPELLLYAGACSGVVILIRFLWMFFIFYLPRLFYRYFRHSASAPRWKRLTILSLIGMRGLVSLAAALSIPQVLPNGDVFPFRDLLIFLTYCVILTTLLLPTLTLPRIVKLLNIVDDGKYDKEVVSARLALAQAVLKFLEISVTNGSYPPHVLEHTSKVYERWLKSLQANLADTPYSEIFSEAQSARKLGKAIIKIERQVILHLRKSGKIHDHVFYELQRELDIEDLRLKTQRL